jgi:predicted nucleotidyltransferase component of viral defense system
MQEEERASDLRIFSEELMGIVNAKSEILRGIEVREQKIENVKGRYKQALDQADEPARLAAAEELQALKRQDNKQFCEKIDALTSAATVLAEKLAAAEQRQAAQNLIDEESLQKAEKHLQDQRGVASRLAGFNEKTSRLVAELQKIRQRLS